MPGARLTELDRERIGVAWTLGFTLPVIAEVVGKHRCTVWRELSRYHSYRHGPKNPLGSRRDRAGRGGVYRWGYDPAQAQHRAAVAARRPKTAKLRDPRFEGLRTTVIEGLRQEHSPRQISQRLRRDNPGDVLMHVSAETIYQAFYVQSRGALRELLGRQVLRSGRYQRRSRRDDYCGKGRRRVALLRISARPPEVEDRAVPGHWEGDLLVGAGGRSAIGVLVERATRFVVLVHLPDAAHHQPAVFADLAAEAMLRLPDHLRRSLTWDQGMEMVHGHVDFQLKAQLPVYFCDPHSPWQRGSNENTNGLLRQYFPKGTNLARHDQQHLDAVADRLNGRPRQTLGWDTPAERLNQLLAVATAA
jgi:IS30 family transposase